MGLLVDGVWHAADEGAKADGRFVRAETAFRDWVTADGKPAAGRTRGFKAASGRYHLYVSLACPWAHRTLIFRQLKQLQDFIDVTVVKPTMLKNGWEVNDPLYGFAFLYQLYLKADPSYEGRVTVPVLWDKK